MPCGRDDEIELAAKLVVHGDDSPIDVADQAVAKYDVGNFPVAAFPDIGKALEIGHRGGFATGLAAERFIGQLRQLCQALANSGHY